MRIVQINSYIVGSTGNIMRQISDAAKANGHDVYMICPKSRVNCSHKKVKNLYLMGSILLRNIHILLARITGYNGCYSKLSTFILIEKLKKINPDIIHLHNLHNSYINFQMLFNYIKTKKIKVIWTLHDCWPFTGHCAHFMGIQCLKWKNGCGECKQIHSYPFSYVDRSAQMWKIKKESFTNVRDMTIVTPSVWLADLVKQSFLSEYKIQVINNGIDLNIFKQYDSKFKSDYNIANKKMILGVAIGWGYSKGLDVFIKLSEILDDNYSIVLVGTNEKIDKLLPKKIISIHKTFNQEELAAIYSAADVFVNPTREDNYPTVNMEAISCGTPVITFNTGGSAEILNDETGIVVDVDDFSGLVNAIIKICNTSMFQDVNFAEYAKKFDRNKKYSEYIKLFENK